MAGQATRKHAIAGVPVLVLVIQTLLILGTILCGVAYLSPTLSGSSEVMIWVLIAASGLVFAAQQKSIFVSSARWIFILGGPFFLAQSLFALVASRQGLTLASYYFVIWWGYIALLLSAVGFLRRKS